MIHRVDSGHERTSFRVEHPFFSPPLISANVDIIAFNATSQVLTKLLVGGYDATNGQGLAAISSATMNAVRMDVSGVTVPGFVFGTEVEASFADGSGWLQYVNYYGGSTGPLLNLFCFVSGYVLSLPDGTIQSIFHQH